MRTTKLIRYDLAGFSLSECQLGISISHNSFVQWRCLTSTFVSCFVPHQVGIFSNPLEGAHKRLQVHRKDVLSGTRSRTPNGGSIQSLTDPSEGELLSALFEI